MVCFFRILPGSFLAHEAGRWSDDHGMWFFMPRKTKRESGTTFQTLVMGVREKNAGDELWGEWECEENGDGILLAIIRRINIIADECEGTLAEYPCA